MAFNTSIEKYAVSDIWCYCLWCVQRSPRTRAARPTSPCSAASAASTRCSDMTRSSRGSPRCRTKLGWKLSLWWILIYSKTYQRKNCVFRKLLSSKPKHYFFLINWFTTNIFIYFFLFRIFQPSTETILGSTLWWTWWNPCSLKSKPKMNIVKVWY